MHSMLFSSFEAFIALKKYGLEGDILSNLLMVGLLY
jgi:hypothetical protein